MHHDDDELLRAEPRPPLIPAGEYDAIITGTTRVVYFQRHQFEFVFRLVSLGQGFNARMKAYCTAPPPRPTRTPKPSIMKKSRKPRRIPAGSKLGRWVSLIAAFTGGNASRMSLSEFSRYWYRVKVETVTHDHRQQPLPLHARYSKVTDIVAVVGKLSELPPDRTPHPDDDEEQDA